MKNYTKEEVESLISRFEKRELPKPEWTHEAHLVVAVWYGSKYGFDEALDLVRQNITAHNEAVGTPNTDTEGYHETITRFWMLVVARYLHSAGSESIQNLCNGFINSAEAYSSYPLKYFSSELLFSVGARKDWVQPDLMPIE